MSKKPKYDLSNVGGQPKDWLQREHEKEVASNWFDGWKVGLSVVGLLLLAIAAIWLLISGLFF